MTEELKPCPYCGAGNRFTHRWPRLSDPELKPAMDRIKRRIETDPAFALYLLTSAGIANADGTLSEDYGGTAPGGAGGVR